MAYQNKPQFVKEGSMLHSILEGATKGMTFSDFDRETKRDVVYPALRHGLVIKKGDTIKTSQSGKKLVTAAR